MRSFRTALLLLLAAPAVPASAGATPPRLTYAIDLNDRADERRHQIELNPLWSTGFELHGPPQRTDPPAVAVGQREFHNLVTRGQSDRIERRPDQQTPAFGDLLP